MRTLQIGKRMCFLKTENKNNFLNILHCSRHLFLYTFVENLNKCNCQMDINCDCLHSEKNILNIFPSRAFFMKTVISGDAKV